MSEGLNDAAKSADEAGKGGESTASEQGSARTFTQEEVNSFLANDRRASEAKYADALAKAKRFDELEEKGKSELQKATERADELNRELEQERSARLRLEVAQSKGLPAELAARLQGGTKEELEADAEALSKLLPQKQQDNSFRESQGKAPDNKSGDWLRDQLQRR